MKRFFHHALYTAVHLKVLFVLLVGVVLGWTVPTVDAVSEALQIQRTQHPFYLDGEPIQFEAYVMNGHNYVKLRDVAKAFGVEVYWDGSAAQIIRNAPYTGGEPTSEAFQNIASMIHDVNKIENGIYQYSDMTTSITESGESFSRYTQECRFEHIGDSWNWYYEACNSGSGLEEKKHWAYSIEGNYRSNLTDGDEHIIQIDAPDLEGISFLNSLPISENEIDSIDVQKMEDGTRYSLTYSTNYLVSLKQKEMDVLRSYQDSDPVMSTILQQQIEQIGKESYQEQTLTIDIDAQGVLSNVQLERIISRPNGTEKEVKHFQLCEHSNSEFIVYPNP